MKLKLNIFDVKNMKFINLKEDLLVRIFDFTHKVFGDEVIILDILWLDGASFFNASSQLAVSINDFVWFVSIDFKKKTKIAKYSIYISHADSNQYKQNIK